MSNNGIVNIHGKDYMTVAKRVELAHADGLDSIETEVLQHSPVVVIKAIVKVKGKTYTGISSANPAKAIEKSNPYEVAETSAVGRALGFANYGLIEGVASADEMIKATNENQGELTNETQHATREYVDSQILPSESEPEVLRCQTCGAQAKQKSGISKAGKPYSAIFCSTENRSHTVWL